MYRLLSIVSDDGKPDFVVGEKWGITVSAIISILFSLAIIIIIVITTKLIKHIIQKRNDNNENEEKTEEGE